MVSDLLPGNNDLLLRMRPCILRDFIKKNHFFVTNVKPPSTPLPHRVTKNHPLFYTQKTLSEELKNINSWGGLKVWPETLPPRILSSKNRGWRLQLWPQPPPPPPKDRELF